MVSLPSSVEDSLERGTRESESLPLGAGIGGIDRRVSRASSGSLQHSSRSDGGGSSSSLPGASFAGTDAGHDSRRSRKGLRGVDAKFDKRGSLASLASMQSIKDFKKRRSDEMPSEGLQVSQDRRPHAELRQDVSEELRKNVAEKPAVARAASNEMDSARLDGVMPNSIHHDHKGNPQLEGLRSLAASLTRADSDRCCGCCARLKRRLAPPCRQLNRSRYFQIGMFAALVCALFLPDLWIIADRSDNTDLDVILTVVLSAFLFELAVQAIGLTKTYFGSFFFWMDLLGAFSLLLDLTYLPFSTMLQGGGGDESGSVSNNVVIMRAARIAKLGARAGRFTRLVKLLRFLPGMREQGTDAGTAKIVSARLITALSTRVSCLIILMVMIMPLFSMWAYPEQDWSMKSWLDILDKTVIRYPERLDSQLRKLDAFYDTMDYFPFTLKAKDASFSADVMQSLPWSSPRGAPNRKTNVIKLESQHLVCEYNFKKPNQIDSLMNICLLLVVMLLMAGFSLVLSNSVSAIVLRPLEKLLMQVRDMASTIFQSVTDMAVTMRDNDEEHDQVEEELDEDMAEQPATFGNETELLEKVVQKLAVLSEITMSKTVVDESTMEGLGEGDRAVIHGFHGSAGTSTASVWADVDPDDDAHDANYEEMLCAQKVMLENAGLSLELLNSWNLNALELDKARNHAAAMYIVGPHNHGIQFDTVAMSTFLETTEAAYVKSVPYHNWFHAIDVAHCVYRLFHICCCQAYLSSHERYALLVSALSHDVGHPGFNNTFLIETSHELALRYNDKSPLENMHCAKLFEIVSQPRSNVFASLSKPQFQEVRKLSIEAILHTDNAQHFAMIKEVQMVYEVNSEILDASREMFSGNPEEFPTQEAVECFRQPESRKLLVNLLLHVADISNSTKPFRVCRIWAWQVLEEFFVQGDEEKRLGVPVQALNDRDKVNRPFSQVGFIEFLVSPLLFAVMKVLPPTEPLVEQMMKNVKTWHQQWLSETKPPPTEQEKKALTDRIGRLDQKFQDAQQ